MSSSVASTEFSWQMKVVVLDGGGRRSSAVVSIHPSAEVKELQQKIQYILLSLNILLKFLCSGSTLSLPIYERIIATP